MARQSPPTSSVVCAGPHTLGLLGLDAPVAGGPSLPQVAYFAPRTGGLPPVFIEWGEDMVYGLPVLGHGPHAGSYKVARHTPGPALRWFDPADLCPARRRRPRSTGATDQRGRRACSRPSIPSRWPRSAASTTTRPTPSSCSTGWAMSSSGAAPAGTPSSSGRCSVSSWPTWPRIVGRSSISTRFALHRSGAPTEGPRTAPR